MNKIERRQFREQAHWWLIGAAFAVVQSAFWVWLVYAISHDKPLVGY